MNRFGSYLAIFLTILLSLWSQALEAQVITGNVTLNTQAAVDGLAGVTEVTGSVVIAGATITNLDSLGALQKIGGGLEIHNTSLSDIDSLSALDTIGFQLYIRDNGALSSIQGLSGLTSMGFSLEIIDCPSLSSSDGLQGLTTLPNWCIIKETGIIDFIGFSNISSIGDDFLIERNDSLRSLNGLEALISAGSYIWIKANESLENVDSLVSLTSIGGEFLLWKNHQLQEINGLGNVQLIDGPITIEKNSRLKKIDFCNGMLTHADDVTIVENDSLMLLTCFSKLDSLGGILSIGGSPLLSEISGFDSLRTIYGFNCSGASSLQTISAFPVLDEVLANFIVNPPSSLSQISGLSNLSKVGGILRLSGLFSGLNFLSSLTEVFGDFVISAPNLLNLDSLQNLTFVGGDLWFDSQVLPSYSGLDNLTEIGGSFFIHGPGFTNLAGLNSLSLIGGNLSIYTGDSLKSLSGLSSIDTILGDLKIWNTQGLQETSGLSNLKYVNLIEIYLNTDLQLVNGFDSLRFVRKHIKIEDNKSLKSITGFERVDSIALGMGPLVKTPMILVTDNDSLASLNAWHGVSYMRGSVEISFNPRLDSLSILQSLDTMFHEIDIQNNANLVSLSGFDSLRHIVGDIDVINNKKLQSINGFGNLFSVGGAIRFLGDSLVSVEPLYELNAVHALVIGGKSYGSSGVFPMLEIAPGSVLIISAAQHLADFFSLKQVGTLVLEGNSLESFSGGNNLQLTWGLTFQDLPSLTSLPDFPLLESINNGLIFKRLDSLVSLPSFPKLKYIKNLRIEDNASLEDISGLASVDSSLNGGYFGIFDNPKLQICCPLNALVVQKSVAGSSMIIKNNAPGCTVKGIKGAGPCQPVSFNVSGNIFSDLDSDCIKDVSESGTEQMIVLASPGNYSSITDSVGNYYFDLDTGSYQISVFPPYAFYGSGSGGLLEVCDTVKSVDIDSIQANIVVDDWGVKLDSCPQLSTSINGMWNRRCFTQKIKIGYSNYGITDALATKLFVKLPSTLEVVHSSPTPTDTLDNLLIYDLLTLNSGASGSVTISTQSVCSTEDPLGLESCIESWLEASNSCYPSVPGWSEASLELVSSCLNDSLVLFSVINEGLGNMADSVSYRIFADSSLVSTGKLILASLDTLSLTIPSNNQTIRIEVDQVDNHPTNAMVSAAIEGCTPLPIDQSSLGFITMFPNPTPKADPSYASDCEPFMGSFDPNDKAVTPSGLDSTGLTLLDTRLRYRIRFQNTGTDTAFLVRVVDTLDSNLDITTFKLESASHPYTVSIAGSGNPVLTFTFANIELPDSNINEPASHGYVVFSIDPVSGLLPQDRIQNSASIYFDYNDPILTNTTLTTFTDTFPTALDSSAISDIVYGNFLPLAVDSFQIDEAVFYYPVLSWSIPDDDFTDILIQRGTDSLQMTTIAMLDKSAIGYNDTLPQIGIMYYYRVVTVNSNGLSYSNVLDIWQGSVCPVSPDLSLDNVPSSWYPHLSWTDSCEFISSFHVFRGTDSLNLHELWILPDNQTGLIDSSVTKNTTYYYAVQSSNPKGYSPQSGVVSFEVGALSIQSGDFPGLTVYPNPFSEVLKVEVPAFSGEARITLINALGEFVLEEEVWLEDSHRLSTQNLPPGTYLLIIQDAKRRSVRKVIHLD